MNSAAASTYPKFIWNILNLWYGAASGTHSRISSSRYIMDTEIYVRLTWVYNFLFVVLWISFFSIYLYFHCLNWFSTYFIYKFLIQEYVLIIKHLYECVWKTGEECGEIIFCFIEIWYKKNMFFIVWLNDGLWIEYEKNGEEEKRTFCTFAFPLLRRDEWNIFPIFLFFTSQNQ